MTVSEASARDLETIHKIHRSRIDVVTEAADAVFRVLDDIDLSRKARARYGIPGDAFLLVHVGGMNAHKNILGLLKAMLSVIASEAKTHLAIVGDTSGKGFWDNVEALKAFVRTHPPLASHVHFTNYIRDTALADLASLSISVDPETTTYAWGNTLQLADRYGLTVYDAAYLELAQRRSLPLASLDVPLCNAARKVGVGLVNAS